ncbi:hypothetical protein F2Q69_00056342 [Brassica cretica]|uniref:Uncharacterized protein n=1 Tax=Brassica cretica TaxID=69181 RepID=A0A8S9MN03_BRACR|nr:hypothetical protein F2Q69_00056342 [Brassica cretica]
MGEMGEMGQIAGGSDEVRGRELGGGKPSREMGDDANDFVERRTNIRELTFFGDRSSISVNGADLREASISVLGLNGVG